MKQLMDCRRHGLSATARAFGRVVHRHSVVTVAARGTPSALAQNYWELYRGQSERFENPRA